MKRVQHIAWPIIGLGAVAVSFWLPARELHGLSLSSLREAIGSISAGRWILAIASTLLAYIALAWYDRIALLHLLGSSAIAGAPSYRYLEMLPMPSAITISDQDVLLAIDLQADFMPGGALAVEDGEAIVPVINALARRFANVVVTQDWHPAGHASFASFHEGAAPFETRRLAYGEQTLWPDHCVQGTAGAELHPDLALDLAFLILRKGVHPGVDSYSAFVEADGKTTTGLAALLKARGIKRIFACGLATDYCVAFSALDARVAGFETFVIEDACRAIDANDSLDAAWARMNAAEVWRIQSREILG